jgi:hypothetical protein
MVLAKVNLCCAAVNYSGVGCNIYAEDIWVYKKIHILALLAISANSEAF